VNVNIVTKNNKSRVRLEDATADKDSHLGFELARVLMKRRKLIAWSAR